MQSQKTRNTLTRRNWLRDVAIASTSAVVLPSLLISCTDHQIPEPGGLGDPQSLTYDELKKAGENISNMYKWYHDLHDLNAPYIVSVYSTLQSGDKPAPTVEDVLLDVFVKIGFTILEIALEEVPFAGAAIGIVAKEIEKWALGEKQSNHGVDKAIGEFSIKYGDMYDTVSQALLRLAYAGTGNNYPNLTDAFENGSIVFNDKEYTLKKLAEGTFPTSDPATSEPYGILLQKAELDFRKNIWNTMFIEAGEPHTYDTYWTEYSYGQDPRKIIRQVYADDDDVVAAYFRGYYNATYDGTWIREYSFRFNGELLSPDAVALLFKDDLRGNIIHPDALFFRDYVFKQFHAEKPDFGLYCDVTTDQSERPASYYDCSDYEFTAGIFKKP